MAAYLRKKGISDGDGFCKMIDSQRIFCGSILSLDQILFSHYQT